LKKKMAITLCVSIGALIGLGAAYHFMLNSKAVEMALSSKVVNVFENSPTLAVYSLDPTYRRPSPSRKAKSNENRQINFRGFPIVKKVHISETAIKSRVLEALKQSVEQNDSPTPIGCNPRYGINGQFKNHRIDLLIRFNCKNMIVYYDDEMTIDTVQISNHAEAILRSVLVRNLEVREKLVKRNFKEVSNFCSKISVVPQQVRCFLTEGMKAIESDASLAVKLLQSGIERLGYSYHDEKILDDTGLKLALAKAELNKGKYAVSAELYKNVLDTRLKILNARDH